MTSPERPVSLYVIAYNEAAHLAELLPTVLWADEIIVLDSFSTDGTAELCRKYAVRHENQPFQGFGALRNRALELASHDWIVSIDSDERSTPAFAKEVRERLVNPGADAYFVPRLNYFLGRPVRHGGMYPDYRQPQVFDRRRFRYSNDLVHEGWSCDGKVDYIRNPVLQIPFPDISAALRKTEKYTSLMAKRYFDDGRRVNTRRLVLNPLAGFARKYLVQQGFRDGWRGFILASLHGFYGTMKYAKLWELQLAEQKNGAKKTPAS